MSEPTADLSVTGITDVSTGADTVRWTAQQLRHAALLAFPPTRSGTPSTADLARLAGVGRRQVQRWLAGTAQPSDAVLEHLRTRLAPSPSVLLAQQDDARNAAAAARALADGLVGGETWKMWARQGWLGHHEVLIVEQPDLGYIRVAAVHADAEARRRILLSRPRPRRGEFAVGQWDLRGATTCLTRFDALLLRYDVLERMTPWRVRVRDDLMPAGHSDGWLASAPLPPMPPSVR